MNIPEEEKEIFDSFVIEGMEMLDEIEPIILKLDDIVGDINPIIPKEICDSTFRLVHSLKGSAGYLKLNNVSRLCHTVETQLDIFRANEVECTSQRIQILCSFIDVLRNLLYTVQSTYSDTGFENEIEDLIQRMSTCTYQENSIMCQQCIDSGIKPPKCVQQSSQEDTSKENTKESSDDNTEKEEPLLITPEMKETFIQESDEIMDSIEQNLLDLESDTNNQELLASLFRKFHSFKGNSAFFGYQDAEKLAHQTENLIDCVIKKLINVNSKVSSLLFKIKDSLKLYLSELAENEKAQIHNHAILLKELAILNPITQEITENTSPTGNANITHDNKAPEKNPSGKNVRKNILLVEDEPIQSQALKSILDTQGFYTKICANGEEALKVLRTREFHLCISDIFMPGINGKDLCEKINNLFPMLPVLISSGKATREMISEFFNLNVEGYIEKPYERESVLKKIHQALISAENKKNSLNLSSYTSDRLLKQSQTRNYIRVDMSKLDKLMNLVGELIIAEELVVNNQDLNTLLEREGFDRSAEHLHRISGEIQDIAMNVRMIPVQPLFRKMVRLVHDLSLKFGKKIKLNLKGEDTEIDKVVLDQISDPLVHLLRNAADHGIENSEERERQDKDPVGHITISALQKTSEIWIIVKDDGRGLNREKILAQAQKKGLLSSESDNLNDQDVFNLIFQAGFSTAEAVTDVSGRGVGMDVVKKNIEKVKGKIEIKNNPGQGTEFIIRIPLTLAVISGMLVEVGVNKYTIDMTAIKESIRATAKQITVTPDGSEMVTLRDRIYPIYRLHKLHQVPGAVENLEEGIIMVLEIGQQTICLFVDRILDQIETVIKPLSSYIGAVQGVSGCNILGNGDISMILDLDKLISTAGNTNKVTNENTFA